MSADWIPPEGYGRFSKGVFCDILDSIRAIRPHEFVPYGEGRKDGVVRVLLQHDVDIYPERTMRLLEYERRIGIRSNVMLMVRCVDRKFMETTGALWQRPYALDFPVLHELELGGFRFGYHCNAYERAHFDKARAAEIAADDIAFLRKHLTIDWYSAHGGPRDPDGNSNHILPVPEGMKAAHNCPGQVQVDGNFSDGRMLDGTGDVFKFIAAMRPGGLYRLLLHPQYYHDPVLPLGKDAPRG